jgi:D-lyxose ketol-isomerase
VIKRHGTAKMPAKRAAFEVAEPERGRVLKACRAQLRRWKIALPPADPLVLDFGLNDFKRVGEIEFWIANELPAGYCGKYLFVFDGQTCPLHSHRQKHETFFVVKGCLRIRVGKQTLQLKEGSVFPVSPGLVHSFTGVGNALLLELSMPCKIADNVFVEPRTDRWLKAFAG